MSQSSIPQTPSFESWKPETLVQFAHDAYGKMQEQAEQLEQLRRDLSDIRKGYREMLVKLGDDGR